MKGMKAMKETAATSTVSNFAASGLCWYCVICALTPKGGPHEGGRGQRHLPSQMSELLQNWLNNEVGLSTNVSNFEKDFASGYLFGEILHKFWQADSEQFQNKNSHQAKIANFKTLEPILKALGIKCNATLINAVMNGERGAALRLLYQLKMASERSCEIRLTWLVFSERPILALQASSLETQASAGWPGASTKVRQARMEKLTRKFELEKHKQEIVAYEMDNIEQAHVDEQRQIHRFSLRERLRQNRAAKDEWEARGQELWQENMKVRMARESAEARFNEVVFKKQKEKDLQTRTLATSEVLQGTKDFETGLISLGLSRKLEARRIKDLAEEESSEDDDQEETGERLLAQTSKVNTAKELVEALQSKLPTSQELGYEAGLFMRKIKEPVFQQAAQDARALFPISKYDDIRKAERDLGSAHASQAVQEIARQMKHLDELDGQSWNFYYFVVGAIDGSRAVGVGSNKTKRERAAYTALAVTKLLRETGCGPASVSAEMKELASSIRRQLPRPGAKPAAPPRTQGVPKASQQRASPLPADDRDPRRAVPADRDDHVEFPPWADPSQESRSPADNTDPPPWAQAVPADHDDHDDLPPWALPRAAPPRPSQEAPSAKKKANKIPQILEEKEAALEEDDEDEDGEDGEDGEEVILSQPLVTEPPGSAEEEQPEPHIVNGLKQQTWRQEDAQTIRTTGTDDIPLGTDTDPSNYKNLWMAQRASEVCMGTCVN
eukprot:s1445_g7.t1